MKFQNRGGMCGVVLLFCSLANAGSSFAVLGDTGKWNSNAQMVLAAILKTKIRNLILPGDNIYDTEKTYSEIWNPWTQAGFVFEMVALGNHTRGYAEEVAFFKMPGEYFSKVVDDVRFVVINSDDRVHFEKQGKWLEDQIKTSKEKMLFIVLHHPPYTATQFHNWKEREKVLTSVRLFLSRYPEKITGVIAGHDHIAALMTAGEIPIVISGAAQDQRPGEIMNYVDGGVKVQTRWLYPGSPHWVRFETDTKNAKNGQAWVHFENLAQGVTCSAQIAPRPVQLMPNCKATGRAGSLY